MASAAAAISNLSSVAPGNGAKIEPVPGTAKIIHPDDDISLVSFLFDSNRTLIEISFLGRISCFFAEI